ncbi:MAG: hypothetical protein MH204_06875, partial [Fimbriimonadaceae bacterium]|nr:hypothetical protein [Fimbriimonadaceae bacterium]
MSDLPLPGRLLTVPNWSVGRERVIVRRMRDLLESAPVELHFCEADLDHNRTVTAFSGSADDVRQTLVALAEEALPAVNLNRHMGCHPRIGGLDVCPFIPYRKPSDESESAALRLWVSETARQMAERWDLPIFLYRDSASGPGRPSLQQLRRGGFGGLLGRELDPDFGPRSAHPHLGATVMGWRSFLIALNVDFDQETPDLAETLAAKIRVRRKDDPGFAGVQALGFALPSRGVSQLSMNLTQPDQTPIDPIISWIHDSAEVVGVKVLGPELIGVIRRRDLEHCTLVPFRQAQVVEM